MNKGLYIHIPFCLSKCPYCDFYSVAFDSDTANSYKDAVIRNLRYYLSQNENLRFDTVYFGGGTPILLWREICDIMDEIQPYIASDAEITVEANPCCTDENALRSLKTHNVNRISFGLQSGIDNELKALGRRHNSKVGADAVKMAYKAGFDNISGDIMLGIPLQTSDSLIETINYMTSLPLSHISAYMLKIEPDTPFSKRHLILPDEDGYANIYLETVERLSDKGFRQYEISNFAKTGAKSRHNLRYWRCEEYLGIGPAAHSYFNGERFAVGRDLRAFIESEVQPAVITERECGDYEEWAMLKLRLSEGLDFDTAEKRFGVTKDDILKKCRLIPDDLYKTDDKTISLTPKGFLVSNAVIGILTDI